MFFVSGFWANWHSAQIQPVSWEDSSLSYHSGYEDPLQTFSFFSFWIYGSFVFSRYILKLTVIVCLTLVNGMWAEVMCFTSKKSQGAMSRVSLPFSGNVGNVLRWIFCQTWLLTSKMNIVLLCTPSPCWWYLLAIKYER